ncbi:MAG TPA: DPP IV N-terminal domain-containing protein, partial [Verrucomicrobiae bacterium]|nr:DPP IV N-terminal domain-containing protein [Verrucomicrobiae bacterium]
MNGGMRQAVSAAILFAGVLPLLGQGSAADYARAQGLRAQFENKVFRDRVRPHWLPGNRQFWYQVQSGPETSDYILVNAEKGERRPAFDRSRIVEQLSKAGLHNPEKLALEAINFQLDKNLLLFRAGGKAWECSLETYALRPGNPENLQPAALADTQNVPRTSTRIGAESSLHFVNKSKNEVELFWVDENGERRSYGKLRSGEERQQHTFSGHVWLVADSEGKTLIRYQAQDEPVRAEIGEQGGSGERPAQPEPRRRRSPGNNTSPDGVYRVAIRQHNVFLRHLRTEKETELTQSGSSENYFEEKVFWSPDSKYVAVLQTQPGEEHKVYLVESSPTNQVQPKLHSIDYRKPGDKVPISKPHLFDVARAKEVQISDELFENPWSTTEFRWEPDSGRFTFLYNERGHQILRVVGIDAESGKAKSLVEERSRTFIDYSGKFFYHPLEQSHEIIWMSERDGWNHLYLFDAVTGEVKNQITKGEWVVRDVDKVDSAERQIWFRAGGIYSNQDPYYVHYCRINFDGSGFTVLTEKDGNHTVQYSPDRRFIIDTYSRIDVPPAVELRRVEDGKLVCELETADWSRLQSAGWPAPERFVAKGRDGEANIFGVIYRPSHLDQQKKYPILENIYAGPQGSFVPKSFAVVNRMQELAELGFIVVQIDGMGTANRSKKFHDACWKNIADAGFPDRILWIKAAAANYSYMDLGRVGIYGTSAGGQNALGGLLQHGDFYKAGVADCGCHDNRMDKIWWNEQWMGWPIGPHYAEQSNV